MNYTKLLNEILMKNGRSVKLNKKYLMVFVSLFFSTSTTLHATECYELFKKACDETKRYNNGWVSGHACNGNKTQVSKSVFDEYDKAKEYLTKTIRDQELKNAQYFLSNAKKGGRGAEQEFEICTIFERDKYFETGLKPVLNDSSNQASSSGSSSSQPSSSSSSSQTNSSSSNNQSSSSDSRNQSNQSSTNNSNTSSQNQTSSQSNAVQTQTDAYSDLNMGPEQEVLVREAARTYSTKTAAFEASHKGLKRKHSKDDEASRCLIMDASQITNTCDYKVEFMFCAYNPDQNAFKSAFEIAAAFDCEKRQMGMIGIRAMGKAAGTLNADAIYVFGCKDPSLPSDVTYERGRGLSGWCQ